MTPKKTNQYDPQPATLFSFMESIISFLSLNGKIRTAETYTATLRSFRRFRRNEDLKLDAINSETIEAYEAWLQRRGAVPNTTSFYNRILRAVYNRAVDRGFIKNRSPFRHVYTGVDRTVKRALPIATIKKIKTLDLKALPSLDFARDMFMLSFMLRGMSFIDMAYMKKTDLNQGYITYRRRKTGQRLTIRWTAEMQEILDKYPPNDTDFLLPIITRRARSERNSYHNAAYNINRSLKIIARHIGIPDRLTLYVARHSWASAAQAKGIPVSVISQGMGHDSEATTRIYLADLETAATVDRANDLILQSL